MKKVLYMPIVAAIAFLASCSDDKGNYDYVEINDVTVEDPTGEFEAGKTYTVLANIDYLKFNPQINSSFGLKDDSNYEFEWKVYPAGKDITAITPDEDIQVIGTERELNYFVKLKPQKYTAFFIVTDKASGVKTHTQFSLDVSSLTNEGWLVACDNDGRTRMDLIYNRSEEEDLVARDMWAAYNYNPGRPVRLFHGNMNLWNNVATLLVTDQDTYIIDPKDMHVGEDNFIKWEFGITPDKADIKYSLIPEETSMMYKYWVVVDGNNDVYCKDVGVNYSGSLFDFPVNMENDERYNVAPFIGGNMNAYTASAAGQYGCNAYFIYDSDGQRFMERTSSSTNPMLMKFVEPILFQNPTGRDMVYMQNTSNGATYAILKDPGTEDYYFYGIRVKASAKNAQEYYGKCNCPGLAQATAMTFSNQFPYLFYVNGNNVYQYDMRYPDDEAKVVLTFPGETITVLHFNIYSRKSTPTWMRPNAYRLVVGSVVNGAAADECGVIRMYDVPDLMRPLELYKEFDGFGKIVDIVYKERK